MNNGISYFNDNPVTPPTLWSPLAIAVLSVLLALLIVSAGINVRLIKRSSNLQYLYADSLGEESAEFLELEVDDQDNSANQLAPLFEDDETEPRSGTQHATEGNSSDQCLQPALGRGPWWREVVSNATI
mmetsp:Transcript_35714/g.65735  ORF Transcript_35714/g.65735 Transcript_35714/m.65735 type:complete len:129 (-) Transcript_35714:32-418(-)